MKKYLLFFMLAFVACFMGARADELTVATGRTTTNEKIPVYGYYYDTGFRNTVVYPADMLSDMEGGTINAISFYANSDFTALQGGTLQVMAGISEDNALTGHLTGLTPVFSGVPGKDGVKFVITFDTPLDYNGGNLAFEFLLTNANKGTNCPHIYFYGETTGRYTSYHTYGANLTNGNTGVDFLPEITFDYDAAVGVDYAAKVTPEQLNFGSLLVGGSKTLNISLRNSGLEAITPVVTVDGTGFSTTYQSQELASKEVATIPVVFNPTTIGDHTGTVSIDCGHDISFVIPVMGTAVYELTVADGTASSGYLPVYGYWYDKTQKNQMIYPADMLADIEGKKITSMTFYSSSTEFFSGGNVALSLANVEAGTTFPNTDVTPIEDDLIQVYSSTPSVAKEWTITFDNDANFIYEGGDLLVDVVTEGGTYKTMSFAGENGHTGASFYSYNNGNPNVIEFLPKVKFTYEDAGEIEPVYSMEVTSNKNIDCGSVIGNGSVEATDNLVVKNTGNQPIKPVLTITGDNANMFSFTPEEVTELGAKKTVQYTFTFNAPEGTEAGEYTANVTIVDENGNATAIEDVTVNGTVVAAVTSGTVTPEVLNLTIAAEKTTTGMIKIENTGNTAFTPVFSTLDAPFSIEEATEIAAGQSKEYTVTYAPTQEGTNTATLTVTIGTQEPISVTLNGTATEPTQEVVVCDFTTTNMYVPFYGFWSDVYLVESQFIYPAEKLTELNNRKITGVKFFASSNLKFNNGSIQLSIKETDQTQFTSAAGDDMITEMTVAATCVANNASSELEFIFNEPVAYNGGNLAIEVRGLEKCTDVGSDKNYWYGENQSTATAYYHYNTSGDVVYFLPKAEFATINAEEPVVEDKVINFTAEQVGGTIEVSLADGTAVESGVTQVAQGETVTVVAKAIGNYRITGFEVKAGDTVLTLDEVDNDNTINTPSPKAETGNIEETHTFTMPAEDVTINVTFEIPTGIESINAQNVKSIRYYNAAGVESTTPFQGVNIVVREMPDGSKVVTKIVK